MYNLLSFLSCIVDFFFFNFFFSSFRSLVLFQFYGVVIVSWIMMMQLICSHLSLYYVC